jgi:hypothetical protein
MAENVLGLLFEISADPSGAEAAMTRLQGSVNQSLKSQASEFDTLARTATSAFNQMAGSAQSAGGVMLRIFGQVADNIIQQIELQQLSVTETGKAEAAKAAISIKSIKDVAVVRAVEETAEGFAALARLRFDQATMHFLSAAKFGAIAAVEMAPRIGASAGGSHVRGPSASRAGAQELGGGRTAGGTAAPLAPGAASAESAPSGNLTVMVVGEPQAAAWMTRVINQGVLQQDLILTASHTKHSAPAGR